MVAVDLWHDERDVGGHAIGRGVAKDERAGPCEAWLDVFSFGGRQRGEHDAAGERVAWNGRCEAQVQCGGGWLGFDFPADGVAVACASVALGSGDAGELEPGMAVEQSDESLSDEAGSAEHRHGYTPLGRLKRGEIRHAGLPSRCCLFHDQIALIEDVFLCYTTPISTAAALPGVSSFRAALLASRTSSLCMSRWVAAASAGVTRMRS